MAETINASGNLEVLIAKTKADTSSEATNGFGIAKGRLPLGCMGNKPYDAAPLPLLELHGLLRFFIRPDQGNGMTGQTD